MAHNQKHRVPPAAADRNARLMKKLQVWLAANVEARTAARSYGVVTIRMEWADGVLKLSRLNDETVVAPEEDPPDEVAGLETRLRLAE